MNDFVAQLNTFESATFTELRPQQLEVLREYQELRATNPDLGIELPTGAGKTLVALLIADYALERGQRVAYLSGTRQLGNQVMTQIAKLPGLEARQFVGGNYPAADLLAYNQAQVVGVMNYWVYFNSSPKVEPADVIIFDDAHLAEQALSNMFTLRIPREGAIATALFQTICDAIIQASPQSYPLLPALRDGLVSVASAPEFISFFDWERVAKVVSDSIDSSDYTDDDSSAHFAWRAIKANLVRCGVLVGPSAIEIRPYHIPTQTVPGYTKSRERVYLSATLGQTGDIQRRLGTQQIHTISPAIDALQATAKLGKRTFLINPGPEQALAEPVWAFAMKQVEKAALKGGGRVAWLCASTPEADEIQRRLTKAGRNVFRLKQGDDGAVERWSTVPFAHLVTAGRFDGLDFPNDVCRLVIVPSVPAASTEFERFVVAYLGDATYMRYRVGQRVTQALGRANRTPNDAALYLGLDPGFGAALADPSVHGALGQDVRAAVSAGIDLHGRSWKLTEEAAAKFWDEIDAPSPAAPAPALLTGRRLRPGRQLSTTASVDSAPFEVNASTSLWLGAFERASDNAEQAAAVLKSSGELEHAAFWTYIKAHSLFSQRSADSSAKAKAALQSAVDSAPQTAWFVRLQRTIDAMGGSAPGDTSLDAIFLAWDEWIREVGPRALQAVVAGRQNLSGDVAGRVEAYVVLARLCGADVKQNAEPRPKGCRWSWVSAGRGNIRVWMGHEPDSPVRREDVNELVAVVLEEETLQPKAQVRGCLVAASELSAAAELAASNGRIAVIDQEAVVLLFDYMAERFTEYSSASGSGSAKERGVARSTLERRLVGGDWLADLTQSRTGARVSVTDVENAFLAFR
ncbi:DEAD/DEAH box helicase family protein [Cryobacterium sp. 10S3]|uniref:DEAD/DEAH box helicase n=1 Tax=Cryobacterium sp. 10S3 TaxID=3048582 RepID=UPI002AC9D424|nr:DEAD/DEAH box helicase [Cryobacterium sp. 10S3]MEB0288494.1 DEAD/DEAH box helicase family protein [Cryobacterium sp. 10S3]WPX13138.1 DEAD/DEAH box helicase family protein [Cryobacterium sp. 10S3]